MDNTNDLNPPNDHVVRLGIPGLPHLTDSLMAGGVYTLIAETASTRFAILSSSLAMARNDGIQSSLILPQNPEIFIQRLESFGNIHVTQAISDRQMKMFLMQDEFAKKMFRFGAEAFVQELHYFDIPDNSYLLIDQADDLLSLHDVVLALDQVQVFRKWAQLHHVTILLVFTRITEAHSSTINALMDDLTGIVRLGVSRNGLELSFDYWQSPEGTIAGRNFVLTTLETGLYQASTPSGGIATGVREDAADVPEGDEAQFFFMDPDLGSLAKQMQGKWQRVDTLVGMMHATRNLRSATCILVFQRGTHLRQLAESVHTLRLSMGRYARLIVQEKEASLRYQNEALLLKLGLNLVVNRDVPLGRLPLLLESLKGQIFNRDVDINFEAALASVLPTHLRGYQVPARFVKEVDVVLERAETLNIPCALMIGRPAPGMEMVQLMTQNKLSRPGDLITADAECCFVFLNACPQAVLLITLERIFGRSLDSALVDVRFVLHREEIQSEMAALQRSAERQNTPDYTSVVGPPPDLPDIPDIPVTDRQQANMPAPVATAAIDLDHRPVEVVPNTVTPVPLAEPQAPIPVSTVTRAAPVRRVIQPRPSKLTPPPAPPLKPAAPPVVQFEEPAPPHVPEQSGVRQAPTDAPTYQYDDGLENRTVGRQAVPRATRAVVRR